MQDDTKLDDGQTPKIIEQLSRVDLTTRYEQLKEEFRSNKNRGKNTKRKQKRVIKELKKQLEEYKERDREDNMGYRVGLGAILSTIDTVTDVYVGEERN